MRTRRPVITIIFLLTVSGSAHGQTADVLVNISHRLIAEEKLLAGLEAAEKALEQDETHALAWNNKSVALRKMGRYDEALAAAIRATELQPDLYLAWFSKSEGLYAVGRYEEALEAANKVIGIEHTVGWETRGKILDKLGRVLEAEDSYTHAIELNPGLGEAWYSRACFRSGRGQSSRAVNDLKKAVGLDPDLKEFVRKNKQLTDKLQKEPDFKTIVE